MRWSICRMKLSQNSRNMSTSNLDIFNVGQFYDFVPSKCWCELLSRISFFISGKMKSDFSKYLSIPMFCLDLLLLLWVYVEIHRSLAHSVSRRPLERAPVCRRSRCATTAVGISRRCAARDARGARRSDEILLFSSGCTIIGLPYARGSESAETFGPERGQSSVPLISFYTKGGLYACHRASYPLSV